MDRKTSSIINDISTLGKDIKSLKSEQPFGSDTTELKMITLKTPSGDDTIFDITRTLAANERYDFSIVCRDFYDSYPLNMHIAYNKITFQIWVNNMSTPYYGESSGIGVYTPHNGYAMFAPFYDNLETQIINSSSSAITVYIKAYLTTTLENGVLTIYG